MTTWTERAGDFWSKKGFNDFILFFFCSFGLFLFTNQPTLQIGWVSMVNVWGCWHYWQVVGDRWRVMFDMWLVTCDMWRLTQHVTCDTSIYLFFLKLCEFLIKINLLFPILSAHVKRFSVSRMQDIFWDLKCFSLVLLYVHVDVFDVIF